jgi:hypothetical protein
VLAALLAALPLACGDGPESSLGAPEQDQLDALGYLAGSRPAPSHAGVTRHDPRAGTGINLVTSGHAAEAILIAMDGAELHRWSHPFWGPHKPLSRRDRLRDPASYWRRAELAGDGALVAIYDDHGVVKLDRDSRPVFRSEIAAHHDLALLPDGGLFVLARGERRMPELVPDRPLLDDYVVRLDAQGRETRRVSLLDALQRSPHASLLERRKPGARYVLHTNTLELLDGSLAGRIPAFRAGNVLVSMLGLDALAVVDLESERVVWALTGGFVDQHDPTLLANGRLLLFDNVGLGPGASRLLELDPETGAELWSYRGSAEEPFYTRWCGAVQRLPNGDSLVSETETGRAFQVTPSGEIVWEFFNPHRTGDEGELVASLFELRRHPESAGAWLGRR